MKIFKFLFFLYINLYIQIYKKCQNLINNEYKIIFINITIYIYRVFYYFLYKLNKNQI